MKDEGAYWGTFEQLGSYDREPVDTSARVRRSWFSLERTDLRILAPLGILGGYTDPQF